MTTTTTTIQAKVLLVEDEPDIAQVIQLALEREGLEVIWVQDGDGAREQINAAEMDVVILDLILPDVDGYDLCRTIRSGEETAQLPILMLTSKTEEDDIVKGLAEGADDYIRKPFSNRELVARVKAALRRARGEGMGPADKQPIKVGDLRVDPVRHVVEVAGNPIQFTLAEFRLLHFLMVNEGRAFTRKELLPHVVGEGVYVIDRNIDVHVRNVRKKLGSTSAHIVTVRGVGYRFDARPDEYSA